MKGVKMLGGITYERITPEGLWISHGQNREGAELLTVDAVVLCAGQEPDRRLSAALTARGIAHHLIGGAEVAAELDAKRAIDQAARLAARL
jgi:2,4-dienoyl-CoA reductase (NADPH2)